MKEVLVISPNTPENELQSHFRYTHLVGVLGALVTEPRDISFAQRFETDVVNMFGKTTEQAVETAHSISEASQMLVVVIGEPDVNTD